MRKKKMGIIERDLRRAFIHYKEDKDFLNLLKTLTHQADQHIHYYWQYRYFQQKLESVYSELIYNSNPSHKEGKI